MLIKGRAITASVNKQYALQEYWEPNNRLKCRECECLLDPYYRSLRIDFRSKFDFSQTYEGVYITSKRFKDYILNSQYDNLIFYPVNEKNEFFYFQVLNSVVKFDKKKSGIKIGKKCTSCGYPMVYGGAEFFLVQSEPLSDGFYLSDIYWRAGGSGYRPRILIGLDTYENLKAQKFSGLDMVRKVY
jgi:hypothetical protein